MVSRHTWWLNSLLNVAIKASFSCHAITERDAGLPLCLWLRGREKGGERTLLSGRSICFPLFVRWSTRPECPASLFVFFVLLLVQKLWRWRRRWRKLWTALDPWRKLWIVYESRWETYQSECGLDLKERGRWDSATVCGKKAGGHQSKTLILGKKVAPFFVRNWTYHFPRQPGILLSFLPSPSLVVLAIAQNLLFGLGLHTLKVVITVRAR